MKLSKNCICWAQKCKCNSTVVACSQTVQQQLPLLLQQHVLKTQTSGGVEVAVFGFRIAALKCQALLPHETPLQLPTRTRCNWRNISASVCVCVKNLNSNLKLVRYMRSLSADCWIVHLLLLLLFWIFFWLFICCRSLTQIAYKCTTRVQVNFNQQTAA